MRKYTLMYNETASKYELPPMYKTKINSKIKKYYAN